MLVSSRQDTYTRRRLRINVYKRLRDVLMNIYMNTMTKGKDS
jgi:hypothetical protein